MASKTKIYIDGNALVADHFSGVGHYLQGIVTTLDKELVHYPDVSVYLIVPFKRIDRLTKYNFQNVKVKKIPLPMSIFRRIVVRNLLPPMDLLFGKGVYFFPDFVTWPLARSKAITTVHDISFEQVPQFVDDHNAAFLRAAVRNSIDKASVIATVTKTMRQTLIDFYRLQSQKVIVTENAADIRHFYKRSATEVSRVKDKYHIYGKYILSVGNIEPRKNQLALIKAFMQLPRKVSDEYTLVFVGAGGWKNEEINKLVAQAVNDNYKICAVQGRVTDEDLPAVYSGADLFVYPSLYEGFGMPLVEAMSCQTLVVSSNASVMPEVAGEAALYVDPHSIDDIERGLREGLTMQQKTKQELISRGMAQAASFTWENSVQSLISAARRITHKEAE